MQDGTQYAYAVARIRAIENRLLDRNKLERMLDAKTPSEALRVLEEAGYGNTLEEGKNPQDYEKLLREELKKVYLLLKKIAPEPEVFNLFLYKNDYHNLKVLLKAELSGQEKEDILVDTGSIDHSTLKGMMRERNFKQLSVTMKQAIEESLDAYNRTGDPQGIDLILDRACFVEIRSAAEKTGNRFIMDYIRMQIDLLNIKSFLRVKRMNRSWGFLQKVLLEGGNIDLKLFLRKQNESLESFVDEIRFTPCGGFCEEGIETYQATGSLTYLEKVMDDYSLSYIRKARYISLGIEPLIAYLIAKETEIKNVGIIMVGKLNRMPEEIIKERLREVYA